MFCSQASVCVYANDCAYLAARWCASCVTYNASRMTGTDAVARRSVSIASAVSPLTGSGDRALKFSTLWTVRSSFLFAYGQID